MNSQCRSVRCERKFDSLEVSECSVVNEKLATETDFIEEKGQLSQNEDHRQSDGHFLGRVNQVETNSYAWNERSELAVDRLGNKFHLSVCDKSRTK